MRTLGLTSPFTVGEDVRRVQEELRRAGALLGEVDGVLGPETARAFRTEKYWLGYDRDTVEGHGGEIWGPTAEKLIGLVLEKKQLPKPYQQRRAARLRMQEAAEKNGKTLRQKTLANMLKHACPAPDCKEHPAGSNHVPWASEWYGLDFQPWCAMAFTRCAVDAGSRTFKRAQIASYVPNIVHFASVGLYGFRRTYRPLPGHGVCYDWQGDGIFDHVECVREPPASMAPGTPFRTVGGNTTSGSSGDQSNGGGCYPRDREILSAGRIVFFSYT